MSPVRIPPSLSNPKMTFYNIDCPALTLFLVIVGANLPFFFITSKYFLRKIRCFFLFGHTERHWYKKFLMTLWDAYVSTFFSLLCFFTVYLVVSEKKRTFANERTIQEHYHSRFEPKYGVSRMCPIIEIHLANLNMIRFSVTVTIISLLCLCPVMAQTEDEIVSDSIRTTLVIAQPGGTLYSCIGHAAIRMSCPAYNLDYCFSYESENVKDAILTFLAGRLNMGLMAFPTPDYIEMFRKEERGLTEYEMCLTTLQKKQLWETLDKYLAQGTNLPYDYMQRGCAISCINILNEALGPRHHITYTAWPIHFTQTRRELVRRQLNDYPWTAWVLYLLVGSEGDRQVEYEEKIVTPSDLVEVWQNATIDGQPLLSKNSVTLVPMFNRPERNYVPSPLSCSILLLFVTLLCIWKKWRLHISLLLGIQVLLGLLLTFLLFISELPCTSWNWLIVPFNLLPPLLWKWRRRWSRPYAIILFLWVVVLWLYLHKIVDSSYFILTICLLITYFNVYTISKTT